LLAVCGGQLAGFIQDFFPFKVDVLQFGFILLFKFACGSLFVFGVL
jgi:hypothetical protein